MFPGDRLVFVESAQEEIAAACLRLTKLDENQKCGEITKSVKHDSCMRIDDDIDMDRLLNFLMSLEVRGQKRNNDGDTRRSKKKHKKHKKQEGEAFNSQKWTGLSLNMLFGNPICPVCSSSEPQSASIISASSGA